MGSSTGKKSSTVSHPIQFPQTGKTGKCSIPEESDSPLRCSVCQGAQRARVIQEAKTKPTCLPCVVGLKARSPSWDNENRSRTEGSPVSTTSRRSYEHPIYIYIYIYICIWRVSASILKWMTVLSFLFQWLKQQQSHSAMANSYPVLEGHR